MTDQKPLTWVFSVKDPSSRLLRWSLKLEVYDYQVIYKPGIRNTNADASSRITMNKVSHVLEDNVDIPNEERKKIVEEFHEQPIGGHLGMNRTVDRIKLYTSWPGMKQDIEDYIRKCEVCQNNKIIQRKMKPSLKITDTPEIVWQNCSMDIVGPMTQSHESNRYLLTFQDELSKYTVVAIPVA